MITEIRDLSIRHGYIPTEDKRSVLGKHYYLRLIDDVKQEVIAITENNAIPLVIDAKTMRFLGQVHMCTLCELTDVKVLQRKEPTAYLKSGRDYILY